MNLIYGIVSKLGWKLMGYPLELPFWEYVYRLGSRICNWGLDRRLR